MSDQQIDELTLITNAQLATDDLAVIRDTSADGTDAETKAILVSELDLRWQPLDAQLTDIAALTPTDSNFIVGDGANFVLEDAATARTSLGLVIGTNVQAWDDDLDDIAALTPTKGNVMVGDGTDWQVLTVGSNDQVLTADTAETTGLKWAAAAGGGGAPFADTTNIVKGSADATKLLRFEVDGFTTATTRVLTPPDADITIAGLEQAQTFSANQTINSTSGFPLTLQYNGTPYIIFDNTGTFRPNTNGGSSIGSSSRVFGAVWTRTFGTDLSAFSFTKIVEANLTGTTDTADVQFQIDARKTTAAGVGFGGRIRWGLRSTTANDRDATAIDGVWSVATDASRSADIVFSTVDAASALTERLRLKSGGVLKFSGTMGNGSDDPTTDAPTDWVEVDISGTTYYVPAYN